MTSGSRGWAKYYAQTGDAFIRITNLKREQIALDLSDLRYVRLPPEDTEGARTSLRLGDLLISITADIGIVGIVDEHVPLPAYINQHIAILRFQADKLCTKFAAYALASSQSQKRFRELTDAGAKAGMSLDTIRKLELFAPGTDEQRAIVQALSDIDDLIGSLDALITKKRDIKQGAMQQLLTGKRRLPGFSGEWSKTTLGRIARIGTGSRNNKDKSVDGVYLFFVRSQDVERIDSYSYDCEAILIPGEGNIGKIYHYINGKFEAHQRVYVLTEFHEDAYGRFIYLFMRHFFERHAMANTVKATVDSLRRPTFESFKVLLPATRDEQRAIVDTINKLEEEESYLIAKRKKSDDLRQGMMQQLLTGRIRLG